METDARSMHVLEYHIYQELWEATIEEELECQQEC